MKTTTRDWPAVGLTLLWPGLGHMQQGRTTRGVAIALWGAVAVLGWELAPVFGLSEQHFLLEMLLISLIACADVVRRPRAAR